MGSKLEYIRETIEENPDVILIDTDYDWTSTLVGKNWGDVYLINMVVAPKKPIVSKDHEKALRMLERFRNKLIDIKNSQRISGREFGIGIDACYRENLGEKKTCIKENIVETYSRNLRCPDFIPPKGKNRIKTRIIRRKIDREINVIVYPCEHMARYFKTAKLRSPFNHYMCEKRCDVRDDCPYFMWEPFEEERNSHIFQKIIRVV